jgi:hypothetical protein
MFYARWTEAWYQLSQEQRDAITAKMTETGEKVGAKQVLVCDSSWNSEHWLFWGVEEFPSMEALQDYSRCLSDLDWFRYCDSEILLGTPWQPEPA